MSTTDLTVGLKRVPGMEAKFRSTKGWLQQGLNPRKAFRDCARCRSPSVTMIDETSVFSWLTVLRERYMFEESEILFPNDEGSWRLAWETSGNMQDAGSLEELFQYAL